jgi:putative FmdB family regulatory protein
MFTDPVAPAVVAVSSKSSEIAGRRSGMVLRPKVCDTTPARVMRTTLSQLISDEGSTAKTAGERLVYRGEKPELAAGLIFCVTKPSPRTTTPLWRCPSHHPTIVFVPVYSYRCHKCDETFDQRRPMSESGEPATCPVGHLGAKRQLSTFVSVGAAPQSTAATETGSWTGQNGCCGGGCHSH